MSSAYTPPGYLTFKQLFSKVLECHIQSSDPGYSVPFDQWITETEKHISDPASRRKVIPQYSIYDVNEVNQEKLKALLHDPQPKASFSIIINELVSNNWRKVTSREIIFVYKECQNDEFCFIRKDGKQAPTEMKFSKSNLRNLLQITKSRQFIRDILRCKKTSSFILSADTGCCDIPETVWINDSDWYRLIIDGYVCIPTRYISESLYMGRDPGNRTEMVLFKEEDVIKACLESQAKSIPESKLLLELLGKSEKGELTLRAAERLYLTAKITFPYTIKMSKGNDKVIGKTDNKVALERDLEALAQELEFKIVAPQKEKGPFNEEDSLTKSDIKSIASLLRSVTQQGK